MGTWVLIIHVWYFGGGGMAITSVPGFKSEMTCTHAALKVKDKFGQSTAVICVDQAFKP